jgi:hypothetical protein
MRDDECEASERPQPHPMSLSRDNKCISEHSNVGEGIDYHCLGFATHSVE